MDFFIWKKKNSLSRYLDYIASMNHKLQNMLGTIKGYTFKLFR